MRRMRKLRNISNCLAVVLISWLSSSPAIGQVIVQSPVQADTSAARVFWNAARKANANPMPLRSVTGTPTPASPSILRSGRTPGEVDGNPPAKAASVARAVQQAIARAQPQGEVDTEPAFGVGSTEWYSYPPPSSLYVPVLDYIVAPLYPHTAVGKLFFSDSGGAGYVCSAASITSAGSWGSGNRQTVVTAGHCCSDGSGHFYNSWLFEPAYLNGTAPLGSWTALNANVFTVWHTDGDLSRDVCVLQMNTLDGDNINDAVGALGYAFDQTLPQHYHATGWPQAAPFDGNRLYIAAASDAETDTAQAGALPYTHGIGNSMTGGSSGGAWIRKYQTYAGANQFNGLNSYKYTVPNRPAEMFGPYIDADVINVLLQNVATSPPAP